MIPDVDIWRAALLMVKRYGDDAMLEAAASADQLMADGDVAGCTTWQRILDAIERLQAEKPGAAIRLNAGFPIGGDAQRYRPAASIATQRPFRSVSELMRGVPAVIAGSLANHTGVNLCVGTQTRCR